MASSNAASRLRRCILATGILLVLALAWGPAAGADGPRSSGQGFLVAKKPEARTLVLEDEVLVRVDDDTRIYDGDRKRIAFESIPEPESGQILVEYSGDFAGRNTIRAERLVVKRQPN